MLERMRFLASALSFTALLAIGCGSSAADDVAPTEDGGAGGDAIATGDGNADSTADTSDGANDSSMDDAFDAGPPAVRFVGRFDTSDAAGPKFEWSGSQIIARFSGTGVRVKLQAGSNVQLAVIIDGGTPTVLKPMSGTTTYTLASGLAAGTHEVTLWRRSEAFFGEAQFLGFEFDGGMLLPPSPPPAHKIEIIGDSITCGYGNEGAGPSCMFTADTENNYLAYDGVAARQLGADLVAPCWSGIGMYRNYDGATTGTMPEKYPLTEPTLSKPWDFTKWIPDVVVINLGTNDFAKGDPGMAYQTAYLAFVRDLRKHYPSAWIFAVEPVDGSAKYIDAVISTLAGEGDKKITSFVFAPRDAADGWGCDYHPSVATDAKMGKQLADAIKAKVGW